MAAMTGTRTQLSEDLHRALLESARLSDALLASLLSATPTVDPHGADRRLHCWVSILGAECVTEFKHVLTSAEAAARAAGDLDRANDCRDALGVLQIAESLQS